MKMFYAIASLALLLSLSIHADIIGDSAIDREDEGVRLQFIVDEKALVYDILSAPDQSIHSSLLKQFRQHMRTVCSESFSAIDLLWYGMAYPAAVMYENQIEYKEYFEDLVKEARAYPLYPILLSQTEERLRECKEQWENNYKSSCAFMSELTGLPFRHEFKVYITHPEIKAGCNFGGHRICWGGSEWRKNYTTVYLWHEILHSYLTDPTYLSHAIIELATDVELMHYLNGFEESVWPGHGELKSVRTMIGSDWTEFARARGGNIIDFYAVMSDKYPPERYPE